MTPSLIPVILQWMLQNFCEVSPDYTSLLRRLSDPAQMRLSERIVQFPFVLPAADEKSSEEIARAAERRREQGRKLQELAAKARLEKVCYHPPPLIGWYIQRTELIAVRLFCYSLCRKRTSCSS